MHGQEITEEIEKRKGEKPSPGTIYPALKHMREAGLITETKEGKTITYDLTDKGKEDLKIAKSHFCKVFSGVFMKI